MPSLYDVIWHQCDQIGRFLNDIDDQYFCKSSPNA